MGRNEDIYENVELITRDESSDSSVGWPCKPSSTIAHRQQEENDILEVVFRFQFNNNDAHGPAFLGKKIKTYYLSLGKNEIDPSEDFMHLFIHHKPL